MSGVNISFRPPGPVAKAFMKSRKFVRNLRGPVGSAKSSTCTVECLRMMMMQEPSPSKIRKTRGAVIRNTNPMLRTTTLNTWKDWIPEALGPITMHPPPFEQEVVIDLPDGTQMVAEVYFLALDRPEDMKKLLSLELTWGWINEAREVGKTLVDGVTQRLRRFPRMQDGGPTRSGLIMDTNPPPEDHWWAIMSGDVEPPEGMSEQDITNLVKPDNWEFFAQPPAMFETKNRGIPVVSEELCIKVIAGAANEGVRLAWERKLEQVRANPGINNGYILNPNAENLENLHPDYYPEQIKGKAKSYIDVYALNEYGSTAEGRAVQPDFNREIHVAKEPLVPWDGVPFIISCDFGLTPAAVLKQKMRGRYQTLAEIVLTDGAATELAIAVNRVMRDRFPGFKIVRGWGDPSGDNRSQADKKTPFQIMRAAGIPCRPTESNDPEIRRAAGRKVLTTLTGGAPLEIIDPSCKVLIAGLAGSWCYKRVQGAGETYHDEPLKNRFSHVCEAWEYGAEGEGEHRSILGKKAPGAAKVSNVRGRADPMGSFNTRRRSTNPVSAWRDRARVP